MVPGTNFQAVELISSSEFPKAAEQPTGPSATVMPDLIRHP
jgi:hypothetical protein